MLEVPMVSLWKTMQKMEGVEVEGQQPVKLAMELIEQQGGKEELLLQCGQYNQDPKYESTAENVLICWTRLILHAGLYALFAVGALEYMDKDKR